MLAPAGIQNLMTRSRVNAIESRLPDFLRDVAEASKCGSNWADSIVVAAEGEYGVLTEDIKQIAAQIEWGVSVDETLEQFSATRFSTSETFPPDLLHSINVLISFKMKSDLYFFFELF